MSDTDIILGEISETREILRRIEVATSKHNKQIRRILKSLTATSNIIKRVNTPILVELEMMKAANQVRLHRGESIAYSEDDFAKLLNKTKDI